MQLLASQFQVFEKSRWSTVVLISRLCCIVEIDDYRHGFPIFSAHRLVTFFVDSSPWHLRSLQINALVSWHFSHIIKSFHECDLQSEQIMAPVQIYCSKKSYSVVIVLSLLESGGFPILTETNLKTCQFYLWRVCRIVVLVCQTNDAPIVRFGE